LGLAPAGPVFISGSSMTTTKVFYPHAIRATAIAGGAELFLLSLLDDVTASHNFGDLVSFAAAQVGPQFTGSHMASPDIRFSTPQLGTLLPVTVAGAYGVVRDLSLHNVDLWYRQGLNLGMLVDAVNTNHLQLRGQANAMMAVESIGADQGQLATARARLAFVLNASTGLDPLVPTGALALGGAVANSSLFTLGPVKVNGTALDGVEYAGVDFNLEYEEHASAGDGFLTYVGVARYRPVISIRARATDLLATFTTRGAVLSSLSMYLRQKLVSGINIADNVAAHIKLTASAGTIKAHRASGGKSLVELTIEPYQTAMDVAPVAIAVNQLIT
jgi:hypothetical protein